MAQTREETLRKYYLKNKEDIIRRQKLYTSTPEAKAKANERQKKYYQKYKPEPVIIIKQTEFEKKLSRKITIKKYYESNKETIREKNNLWRLSVPGRSRLYCAKRRFLKTLNGSFRITVKDINRLLSRQRHECFWCGIKLNEYHIDHVIPLAKGGRHSIGNIVCACKKCNHSKLAKLPIEFKILMDKYNLLKIK